MSFAEAGNGAATAAYAGGYVHKVAQLVTFPNITGRDAPGKTGAAAKPGLLSDLGITLVSSTNRTVRPAVWSSTGTSPYYGSSFTIPNNTLTQRKMSIDGKVMFSGTKYFVGAVIMDPVDDGSGNFGFGWGIVPGTTTSAADRTALSTSQNFVNQLPAGPGALSWRLYYDVLPTAPLSLSGTVGGPQDTDVTLTWSAPSSDGGQAVNGYRIQSSTNNKTWTTVRSNTGTTTTSRTITNLIPGVRYYFRVAAINNVALAAGSTYSGPYSATFDILIPDATPGNALSLLTATVANPEPNPVIFSDFGPGIRFTSIDVQYGSEYLYNEVQATTQDSFAETQTASAPGSKAIYGIRTYAVSSLLNATDQGAFEVAKDLLTYYYQPELRVQSITVDLANLTIEQKLQVLDLEIDDYISVSFTPNGIGGPKVASGLVTGIAHRVTLTSHEVELRLRTERNLFTLDSDSKGILDVNILGP